MDGGFDVPAIARFAGDTAGTDNQCCARMLIDDKFFREIESNCWDAEVRMKECDHAHVDMQVLSTVPVMFSYWAKDADGYQNIMDFKEGFQTVVGERGITLSGGQKQRVSIARALVRKPQIMVLDDCLSAVDTKTENAILNSLQALMENKTSIIISHRISSAKLADRIIVLEDGKIAQQGAHSILIAQEGLYKDLYERQLQGEETAE